MTKGRRKAFNRRRIRTTLKHDTAVRGKMLGKLARYSGARLRRAVPV